ncbi:MAG: VCBS repeat-containing protein [Acidiferrobacterales bacterium]|nr:VCBS repeat-containing protein [Acidiferrobacterales bacterium]
MRKLLVSIALLFICYFSSYASACVLLKSEDSDFPESISRSNSDTGIATAWYDGGTGRYRHGVLGDSLEPSILRVTSDAGCTYSVELGRPHVFEDIQTRLADIDRQPGDEVITIRSHQNYGAQIAVYQLGDSGLELFAETPYIGTTNRWLAPIGIADINNDGDMDIAFVDRPHLAKTLRVWTYRSGELQEIASRRGYSNHRIGEDFISGGIKTCKGKKVMITADAGWRRILASTLENDGQITTVDIGPFDGAESFERALQCD